MAVKSTYNFIFLLILVVALTLISGTFTNCKFASGADEGYYFKYSVYIAENGLSGFKALFQDYLANKSHWVFPSPLRAGFIILAAFWLKVFGYSFINLAYLSLLFFVLFLCLSYHFSKKYLGQRVALLFVALLTFSPLNLALSRRALMDSSANFFLAASVWLFWDYLKSRNRIKLIYFILAYSFSILIKESSVLLTFVFLAYLILSKLIQKNRICVQDLLIVSAVPFATVFLVYLGLGCVSYLPEIARIVLGSPGTNPYAIFYGSGPWFRYLVDYMLLSPWVVILSIGFLLYCLLERENDALIFYFTSVFLFSFTLLNLFTKNVRYVILLDTPMRLFSCLLLDRLSRKFFPRQALIIACILVAAISLSDYLSFRLLFINNAIYDPASFFLLKARQFIP